MIEIIKEMGIIVGVPILRSIAGWAENSLSDGNINEFEWKRLGETVIRVGLIAAATYYGLGKFFDVNIIGAGASAFLIDKLLLALKKK